MFRDFGRNESVWLPYWKNASYLSITPLTPERHAETYASLYKHPTNGVLVVMANFTVERDANGVVIPQQLRGGAYPKAIAARVDIRLNRRKLGMPDAVTAMDAISRKPLQIRNGHLAISLRPMGWRAIWIRPQP
jgi:hypothetical protein